MRDKLYDLGFILLLVLALVSVTREWREPRDTGVVGQRMLDPVDVDDWSAVVSGGHILVGSAAPVKLVQFADFECPACQVWNDRILPSLLRKYEGDVQLVWRHWPLSYHLRGYPSARASECAAAQGRFREFHSAVSVGGYDLSETGLARAASRAQIEDSLAWDRCARSTAPVPAIDASVILAAELGGSGTPAFAVDGVFHRVTPDSAQLDSLLFEAIQRRARR